MMNTLSPHHQTHDMKMAQKRPSRHGRDIYKYQNISMSTKRMWMPCAVCTKRLTVIGLVSNWRNEMVEMHRHRFILRNRFIFFASSDANADCNHSLCGGECWFSYICSKNSTIPKLSWAHSSPYTKVVDAISRWNWYTSVAQPRAK